MKRKRLQLRPGFHVIFGNARSQAAEMVIPPGKSEGGPRNRHHGADQWLYVIAGSGTARINKRRYALKPRDLLLIAHGDEHEIKNTGRSLLRTLNFYSPLAYTKAGEELPAARPD